MRELFHHFSAKVSNAVGSPYAFILSILIIVLWASTGSFFSYSDTWQLIINTGTTIVTFLMVFLIQNTQNRDSKALHIKLDELLKSSRGARNSLVDIEDMEDEELERVHNEFRDMHQKLSAAIEQRQAKK